MRISCGAQQQRRVWSTWLLQSTPIFYVLCQLQNVLNNSQAHMSPPLFQHPLPQDSQDHTQSISGHENWLQALSSLPGQTHHVSSYLPRHTSCFHLLTHITQWPCFCSRYSFLWTVLCLLGVHLLIYSNKCLSTCIWLEMALCMLEILAKLYQKKNESRFNTLEAESFCRTLLGRTLLGRWYSDLAWRHTIHLMLLQRCRFCFIQSSTEPRESEIPNMPQSSVCPCSPVQGFEDQRPDL